MRKLFKQLHIWLSIPFGVVMSITCLTGAMLIFEDEITRLAQHDIYYVEEVKSRPMPLDELIAMVEPTLASNQEILSITSYDDVERSYEFKLSNFDKRALHVDQYSGEVLGQSERIESFRTIFRLHRWLMDSRPADGAIFWGKMVVGVSTLLMVIVIITGVVLWWPKSLKMWITRSKIQVRRGWHRFWYDLHVVGGIYATLLLLVMALTGLTWSFEWYRNGFYELFSGEAPAKKGAKHGAKQQAGGDNVAEVLRYEHWHTVYAQLSAENPGASKITISDGAVNISPRGVINKRATDSYSFDVATGEITSRDMYRDRDNSRKLRGVIYSLHVGNFGGVITKVLWFLAAMLGAALPITGYYLWIKRKFCHQKS